MTLEDVRMLTDYWAKHPPACELIEMQIGWKVPVRVSSGAGPAIDLDAFAADVNGAAEGGA